MERTKAGGLHHPPGCFKMEGIHHPPGCGGTTVSPQDEQKYLRWLVDQTGVSGGGPFQNILPLWQLRTFVAHTSVPCAGHHSTCEFGARLGTSLFGSASYCFRRSALEGLGGPPSWSKDSLLWAASIGPMVLFPAVF